MFTRKLIQNLPRLGQRLIQTQSSTRVESTIVHVQNIFGNANNCSDLSKAKSLEYQFAAININNGNLIPPSIKPPAPNQRIEEPGNDERKNIDTPVSTIVNEIMEKIHENKGDLDLPPLEGQDETKEAAVMIEIRRLKMKKHKRKKLLKKMKFVFAKRALRRKMKREKEFQAMLLAQIKDAEKFSAEQYVADKISRLKNVPPPQPELVRIF